MSSRNSRECEGFESLNFSGRLSTHVTTYFDHMFFKKGTYLVICRPTIMFDCNTRINVAGNLALCKIQQLDLLQSDLQHLDSHKKKTKSKLP